MLSFSEAIEFIKTEQKRSQESVDYQAEPFEGEECAGCSMFLPPSACTEVESPIMPNGWCRLWEEKKLAVLEKSQPVAADVHTTTALGNEGKKRKAKDFLTTIAEIKGGAKVVQPPPAPVDKSKDKSDTMPLCLVRHGATKLNNETDTSQDRIRAWSDVPLTDEGRDEARRAAKKLAKHDIEVIVCSDLSRAEETASIIGKELGIKPSSSPKLRPWDLGKFTGMSTKEALPKIAEYVERADEPVPEGESFNDFRARAFEGIAGAFRKAGGKNLCIVSHHRNERLLTAWDEAGQPSNHTIDLKEFLSKGDPPGGVIEYDIDVKALSGKQSTEAVAKKSDGKITINVPLLLRLMEFAREDASGDIDLHVVAERIIDAGGDLGMDDYDDLVEGLAKALKERPDGMAHSPFPHDAHALANLRPDQVPRFLGALTDQDSLPVKSVRLDGLVAMQDRVDPEKVESMRGAPPDKLPLVVQNGRRKIVADGHHRLTAMHLDGRKTAQVRFADITAEDSAVKREQAQETILAERLEDIPTLDKRHKKQHADNADWTLPLDIVKTDRDRQLVFGWASISSVGGELIVDKQNDIIPEDELENAAYEFVLYVQEPDDMKVARYLKENDPSLSAQFSLDIEKRTGAGLGDMHERMGVGRLVESMVFTKQKQDALGIDLGLVGWFVGFKVDDDGVWKRIKAGELPEFSIGGKAVRSET